MNDDWFLERWNWFFAGIALMCWFVAMDRGDYGAAIFDGFWLVWQFVVIVLLNYFPQRRQAE